MLKRKKVKPITLRDVTIIDDGKLRKAITAASLGNAMEWFDFGVYGFVAYALGKVFFPGADPSVQMVAALATFSVPFLIRPLGGLFFGMLGDKYGRQKILAITIVNRPGFPGEYFICELRLPDHYFRWKHNKLFLLL
ncbi:MFS transporter, partial [Escherichia coli]|uniref:MFS transporter n=1 Tax=Escherichia coli TaxID=562 RepID=UPI001FAAA8DD